MWSILLMVLARRGWPSPPISSAVYLTSFGPCRVSKVGQENNNVRLSACGELMKGGGSERRKEQRGEKLQPLLGPLEQEEAQRCILKIYLTFEMQTGIFGSFLILNH